VFVPSANSSSSHVFLSSFLLGLVYCMGTVLGSILSFSTLPSSVMSLFADHFIALKDALMSGSPYVMLEGLLFLFTDSWYYLR
jgi:hypothetical protein